MKIRYHAWMNRAINGERFSAAEHALYAACALGLGAVLLGAFALFFEFPSNMTLLAAVLVSAGLLWVMAANRRYVASLSSHDDPQ